MKFAKKVFISQAIKLKPKELCRILGVVVSKYETENYIIINVDDATGVISLRAFGDDKTLLENVEKGQSVDVVGEVREYRDEKYIYPHVLSIVNDPNFEILRKLEIYHEALSSGEEITVSEETGEERFAEEEEVEEDLKYAVLRAIIELDTNEGVSAEKIVEELKLSRKDVEEAIKKLINEGEIFEPRVGVYKAI